MIKIKYRVTGIDKLGRFLAKNAPDDLRKELAKQVMAEAKAVRDEAQSGAPAATGELRKDIIIRRKNKGLTAIVGVFAASRGYIARFLTFGTKPHLIVPKNANFLKIANNFVKVIHHPGIKPKDFLLGPTQSRRKEFQDRMRAAMLDVLRKMNS